MESVVLVGSPEDRLRLAWGANIAAARKRKGWSQKELGLRSGLDQSTIARYEKGETKPFEASKIRLARALGRNPAKLFPLTLPEE